MFYQSVLSLVKNSDIAVLFRVEVKSVLIQCSEGCKAQRALTDDITPSDVEEIYRYQNVLKCTPPNIVS